MALGPTLRPAGIMLSLLEARGAGNYLVSFDAAIVVGINGNIHSRAYKQVKHLSFQLIWPAWRAFLASCCLRVERLSVVKCTVEQKWAILAVLE
jgi:hypothetical protein